MVLLFTQQQHAATTTTPVKPQQRPEQPFLRRRRRRRGRGTGSVTTSTKSGSAVTTATASTPLSTLSSSIKRFRLLRRSSGPAKLEINLSPEAAPSEGGESSPLVVLQNTRILTSAEAPPTPTRYPQEQTFGLDEDNKQRSPIRSSPEETALVAQQPQPGCESATAILHHSFMLCGGGANDLRDEEEQQRAQEDAEEEPKRGGDDPTVQESIECIFASQLEAGLPNCLLDEDEDEEDDPPEQNLLAPSVLQQSLLKRRSSSSSSSNNCNMKMQSKRKRKQRKASTSLRYVGTYDPNAPKKQDNEEDKGGCCCRCNKAQRMTPALGNWPQGSLLLCPGPGTRVLGVRYVSTTKGDTDKYLWTPTTNKPWWSELQSRQGSGTSSSSSTTTCCSKCKCFCSAAMRMPLPINNGNETPGKALVTDFDTDLFEGTMLLRIRHSEGTAGKPYDDAYGYFAGMNRRYQAVIQGRFRQAIPLTQCMTGVQYSRPLGKLPPKWIVKGAIKVISFFAPQLQANLDGPTPSSLTPLGSTPQCVIVQDSGVSDRRPSQDSDAETGNSIVDISAVLSEPIHPAETLLGEAMSACGSSSMQRARFRKKAFDKLYSLATGGNGKRNDIHHTTAVLTDPSKIYTFEFLQHLIDFESFGMELGSMLGTIPLAPILNQQPVQIMAMVKNTSNLWLFEIWHKSLLEEQEK